MVALTLSNPSFESGSMSGWTIYSNGTPNNMVAGTTVARTGTYSATPGVVQNLTNYTGAYQDVTLPGGSVGETVSFDIYVMHRSSVGGAESNIYIEFYDSGMTLIGSRTTNTVANTYATYGQNNWGLQSVSEVVPAGAVTVRLGFQHTKTSTNARLWYDDAVADVTLPSVYSRVTTAGLEVSYGEDALARPTAIGLQAAYGEPLQARPSFIGLQVLRSSSGVRGPTVMLIPAGWNPDVPIPSTVPADS